MGLPLSAQRLMDQLYQSMGSCRLTPLEFTFGTETLRTFPCARIEEHNPLADFNNRRPVGHHRHSQHLNMVIYIRILHKLPVAGGVRDVAHVQSVVCIPSFAHFFGGTVSRLGIVKRHHRQIRDGSLVFGIPHLGRNHVRMIGAIVSDHHTVGSHPFRLRQRGIGAARQIERIGRGGVPMTGDRTRLAGGTVEYRHPCRFIGNMEVTFKVESLQVQDKLYVFRDDSSLFHLVVAREFHVYGRLSTCDELDHLLPVLGKFMNDMLRPDERIALDFTAITVVAVPVEIARFFLLTVEIFPHRAKWLVLRLRLLRNGNVRIAHAYPTREELPLICEATWMTVMVIHEFKTVYILLFEFIGRDVIRNRAAEVVRNHSRSRYVEQGACVSEVDSSTHFTGSACIIGDITA